MERLTERSLDYCTQLCSDEDAISCAFYKGEQEEKCWRANMYDRLAYYEDLEEQGRLVVLPCKVGDTVFVIKDTDSFKCVVVPVIVAAIRVTRGKDPIVHFGGTYPFLWAFGCEFGKRFFLTREEAEKALKGEAE